MQVGAQAGDDLRVLLRSGALFGGILLEQVRPAPGRLRRPRSMFPLPELRFLPAGGRRIDIPGHSGVE